MGIVYRAQNESTGDEVALKMTRWVREEHLARLRREIQELSRIRHPGIVRVVDSGLHDGVPWLAMELLPKRTLRDVVSETPRGGIPKFGPRIREVLRLITRVCEPLAFLHQRGMVHGDLKPDNVHLTPDGTPILVDFGLLSSFSAPTRHEIVEIGGLMFGTAQYMAPEQIWGEIVDARADLYSLGCMIYEAITGEPPFGGVSVQDVLRQHLGTAPSPPSSRVAGVPDWLDELVLKLLKKIPNERLGYAEVVADELSSGLGLPVSDNQQTPVYSYLYRPRFVGREEALARLASSIEGALNGKGAMALITGESGIGKTRVATEVATLAVKRGMRVVVGQGYSVHGEGASMVVGSSPLYPFRPLLSAIADRCQEKGRSETDRLLGPRGPILAPYEPRFRDCGGHGEASLAPAVSPEAALERLQGALIDTLAVFASADAPVLLILDDLQWADELSLSILGLLQARIRDLPLLVLATCREEEVPEPLATVTEARDVLRIRLERLNREEVRRIVGDMLAVPEAPRDFIGGLFEQTEGNPFFVSEYVLAAAEKDLLYRDARGSWRLRATPESAGTDMASLPIPGSLRDLVRSRIEQLTPAARRIVAVASVLGHSFDEQLLLLAASSSDSEGRVVVQELVRRRILRDDRRGLLSFDHGKIREIAYDDVPAVECPDLHEQAAIAIERVFSEEAGFEKHYAPLAHHWSKAAEPDGASVFRVNKAIDFLERAGKHAADSYAHHEAIRWLEEAVRVQERNRGRLVAFSDERIGRWERHLGEAYYRLGKIAEARQHLTRAIRLMGQPLPVTKVGVARHLLKETTRQVIRHVTRRTSLGRRRTTADDAALEAARAYELLSFLQFLVMDRLPSLLSNLRSLNLAETGPPSPELANSYAMIGLSSGLLLGSRVADHYFRLALEAAAAIDDVFAVGHALMLKGFYLIGLGRWSDAQRSLGDSAEAFEKIGDRRWRDSALLHTGNLHYLHRRYGECLPFFEGPRCSGAERGDAQIRAWATGALANTFLSFGRTTDALRALDEMEQVLSDGWEQLADSGSEFNVAAIRSVAHLRLGDFEKSLECLRRAHRISTQSQMLVYYALTGYADFAEASLRLLERSQVDEPASQAELAQTAKHAVRELRRFARFFPFARPQALLSQGLLYCLTDRASKGHDTWAVCLEAAQRFDMPHEAGLAHFEIGRWLPRDDNRRSEHLELARTLFSDIGAGYDLQRVSECM